MIFDHYLRLEPRQPDYDYERGIQAEVGDPLWFLGRQWQMGEHQGEDTGSPVRVSAWVARRPLDPFAGDPRDPKIVPPEAIVEGEPGGWWTIGRRIRYGALFKPLVNIAALPIECFMCLPAEGSRAYGTDMPAPYDQFNGQADERKYLDGWALWQRPNHSGIPEASFKEIPITEPADLWKADELGYDANITCEGHTFKMQRHPGGHIDWYAVDGDAPFTPRQLQPGTSPEVSVFPTQLTYPGAPNTRYWQIENALVDFGGYPPDRSYFPTMLLTDLLSSHGTQWFQFPVATQAGNALTVERVVVRDSFGDDYDSDKLTELKPPSDWSLFRIDGLDFNTLIVWPTALTPLTGAVLEEVILGIDGYSNLLWAVERRVNSRDIRTPSFQERNSRPAPPPQGAVNAAEQLYHYLPAIDAVPYWHPYILGQFEGQRRFIQARLVDYSGATAMLMEPVPAAHMLYDPRLSGATDPYHTIDPAVVPSNGLVLERRWMLARDVNGQPVLWIARQRGPLLSPPGRHLRFDVMEKVQP